MKGDKMYWLDYLVSAIIVLGAVILIRFFIAYIVWWNIYKRNRL